ncbi:MAG: MATE family efflux transporter [Prevotellaceae bacterium]|nr:MATE family efflux transporter [Prevotellaceae bacterium]
MMNNSSRLAINVGAQYIKTILNVLLSMYSTRLILILLGSVDYGIYSLIAGVVAMLSFLSNAMIVSTQRFLSYYHGEGNRDRLKLIFSDSFTLHLIISIAMSIILVLIMPLLFNGFLKIPAERVETAEIVYIMVVFMLAVTLISAPFNAAIISNEDIYVVAIIDVVDGLLKIGLVILLAYIPIDKLIGYAILMTIIQCVKFIWMVIVCLVRYPECQDFRITRFGSGFVKELSSFAGWTIYSNGCIIGRTQGVAVLINRFIGPVANAAFGIALQVSGFVSFAASSLQNAMAPRIMKAEGKGERARLLSLSSMTSKYSILLLSCIIIPVSFFIQPLLEFWLGKVPEGTSFFCVMVLYASLADSITISLGLANQAIGKIRNYSIIVNSIKLLTLLPIWYCLNSGFSVYSVAVCYIGFELICATVRLPFLKFTAGLNVGEYIQNVVLKCALPITLLVGCMAVCKYYLMLNFIVSFLISISIYGMSVFHISLSKSEKDIIVGFCNKLHR